MTRTLFDSQGRTLQRINADGGIETWTRDSNGLVTAYSDPLGRVTAAERERSRCRVGETSLAALHREGVPPERTSHAEAYAGE